MLRKRSKRECWVGVQELTFAGVQSDDFAGVPRTSKNEETEGKPAHRKKFRALVSPKGEKEQFCAEEEDLNPRKPPQTG